MRNAQITSGALVESGIQLEYRNLKSLFAQHLGESTAPVNSAAYTWRVSCFDSGLSLAEDLVRQGYPLRGATVVDAACAWGGHALAFASLGATVFASDLSDHSFAALNKMCRTGGVAMDATTAPCEFLPLNDEVADVLIALELIEHIPVVSAFAREAYRVLKPGGVLIVSTPPRIRSILQGEPHYGLRFLAGLPFSAQKPVATRLFKRSYPYPIHRQYSLSSQVVSEFEAEGFVGVPVLKGPSWNKVPLIVRQIFARFLWKYFLFRKV